jgi:outer membrane protein TolC
MKTRTALCAVLLAACAAGPARGLDLDVDAAAPAVVTAAPDSAPAPPPDTLVARALARAPSLAALRARVEQARTMVRPAGALPNPMVEVMLQDAGFPRWTVGGEEMSMIGPQLTQSLPFPGKQAARRRAAEAEVAVRGNELEALRRQVARDVRSLYARIYALDEERQALSAGHELLEMLAATVRARYGAGVAEQEAAVRVQLELLRLGERLDDNTAERTAAVGSVNRLLDQPGDAPLGPVASLPGPAVPPQPWAEAVLANSAEVALRRSQVLAAERRLASARLELRPDLVVGAGAGFRGAKDPVATFRLGLDLPLWSGQSQGPVIRAAGQDLEAARQDLRDAEASGRAEAARLEAEWRRASVQVPRYAEGIVPQTSLAFDAARSGYSAGRADFSSVIEDFQLWLEARAGLARREAERYTTWAELQAAIGAAGPSAPAESEMRR